MQYCSLQHQNLLLSPVTSSAGYCFCFGSIPSFFLKFHSVQFSSVTQSCLSFCYLMNCSTPGLPVHHHLLEFTQTHVRQVGDAIQPSHPLLSPFPPDPNSSQHQSVFQWVSSSHEVAKVLEFHFSIIPSKEIPGLTKYVPNKLLEISGEITPERMKGGSQSKNNTQLQMWLVIEASSDAVKSNIA